MLYHLLYPLHKHIFAFNVFQYITFRAGGAILTALIISFFISPPIIRKLKKFHIEQQIRENGPSTHLAKAGTPSMGGLIILLTLVISTLLWARLDNRFIVLTLFATIWLGFLGFLDDFLKMIRRHSKGLSASSKIIGQFILGLIVAGYLYIYPLNAEFATKLNVPYLKDAFLELGIFYIPFVILVIIGTSNAVNLTDGLDGLAIGSLVIAALTYAGIAYLVGNVRFSGYLKLIPVSGSGELTVFLSAMIGAGLGFLWFNSFPAEVFMGDTGSLFLGGAIGMVAIFIKHELLLVIVGGIFVAEALSVILQVGSFKLRGKRIFRMAPIHHHFELKNMPEPKIVIRFWIVAIILSLIALSSLKLR
ncbi:MAG: phospho-N-acetylmuramoyl-pentapeptide-transferase [bacterium]